MSLRYTCHVPNVEPLLALLKKYGATSATFSESGALLSVTLGPDSEPTQAETQHETPVVKSRHATPRLVPRDVSDRQ